MNRVDRLRHYLRILWPYLAGGLVVIYFAFHLVSGPHGLLAWRKLETQLQEAQAEYQATHLQEETLDRRIKLLKVEIDPDLLREQAGMRLNLHHPDDRILILNRPTP